MNLKLISCLILLFQLTFIITKNNLQFPFYIIPKSKYTSNSTPNNFKSFLETPKIPVSINDKERMCLELCFGTPKSCQLLTIHPQSFLIWVQKTYQEDGETKLGYDPEKSTTALLNNTLIELNLERLKTLNGYMVIDRLYTTNSFLFRGSFMSVKESKHYKDQGMIGLGFRGSRFEERTSFVNQLFRNGLIFHKVFTQSFTGNDEGIITFGEIPKEIVQNYKKYGRCQALNKEVDGKFYKNRKWECEVNGIYFGDVYNETYVYKLKSSRASFFSFRKRALVPKEIFDFFEKNYFTELIQNKTCQRDIVGKYDTIKCTKHINEGPKINIIYGEWVMSLPIDKLFMFRKKTESYEFMFYHKNNFEHWSLGRPGVKLFHMVYDYQNQEIGFYSENNVLYLNDYTGPEPPQIYEKLPDLGELVDENENNDPNKVPENEENYKRRKNRKTTKDIIDNIKKESGITENTMPKTFSTAFIIQNAFRIFIIIVIICFILFLAFLYYRHRRKVQYLKSDYFLKKANELSTNI